MRSTATMTGGTPFTMALSGTPEKDHCHYQVSAAHASDTTNTVTVTLIRGTGEHPLDGVNTFSFADKKVLTFEASQLKGLKFSAPSVSGDIDLEVNIHSLA